MGNNNNFNNNFRINNIKEITSKFISTNNYTIHNQENTYFVNQKPDSCIDQIYSNCPPKKTHVTMINNGQSDHAILTAKYHTKVPINSPKIVYTRPKYLLTEHTLNQYLSNNHILQTAYNYTDPDLITEMIMTEYNNIIEIIAPRTKRQVRKNYTPHLNKTTRQQKHNLQNLHNKAKHS